MVTGQESVKSGLGYPSSNPERGYLSEHISGLDYRRRQQKINTIALIANLKAKY